MLSKSKGQILRVSAAFHVLFDIGTSETEETEITDIRRSSDCSNKFCATLLPADCLHGGAGENPGRNPDHQS